MSCGSAGNNEVVRWCGGGGSVCRVVWCGVDSLRVVGWVVDKVRGWENEKTLTRALP